MRVLMVSRGYTRRSTENAAKAPAIKMSVLVLLEAIAQGVPCKALKEKHLHGCRLIYQISS